MRILLYNLALLVCGSLMAQSFVPSCGTDFEANAIIKQRMLENREAFAGKALPRTGAVKYIPVTYHLVARADGTGRLATRFVLENLCAINKLYEDQEIEFYLRGINTINNNDIYNDPSSDLGSARIRSIMNSSRHSVNIFVASIANASKPGVLAFYSPNGDYIVSDDNYVNSNGTTLAHEIGHFFTLAHTFFGWEDTDYHDITNNCLGITPPNVGPFGTLVEYVSRDKPGTSGKKHCEQSADGFCDTPADYNLGFGWPSGNCKYDKCAKDPDGVKLDPDERNMMSYFLSCLATFTQDQKDAMLRDYLSSKRNFLRTVNYTPKPLITQSINYLSPAKGNTTSGYDEVKFEWDPIPNAEIYVFEMAEVPSFSLGFRTFTTRRSDTTLTNLLPQKNYHWRVFAYNSNDVCPDFISNNFRTPAWRVSVDQVLRKDVEFSYRTIDEGVVFDLRSNRSFKGYFSVMDVAGQIIHKIEANIIEGQNNIQISNLLPGVYLYLLKDQEGKTLSGKFISI